MEGVQVASRGLQDAVAERLDTLTSWKVRYWAPFVLGLMMMGDSWDVGIIGYVMPAMRNDWTLTPLLMGTIMSAGFAGQAVGALLFGPLAEKFGRIRILLGAVTVMSVLSVACAMAADAHQFIFLRFLQGVGFGGAVPVCVSYVNELAPTETRGRYFSLFQFLMVSGFAICGFVSAAVIPSYGWRAMFAIGAFPIIGVPLILFSLPESPRWLARLGRVAETNRALVKLGAEPIDDHVVSTVREEAARVPLSSLFGADIRWLTLGTCLLWFLTSLVAYAFSTWTPTFYVDNYHLAMADALRYAAITGIIYMMTPLVYAALLDRVGRRPAGITATAGTIIAVVTLALLGHSHVGLSVFLIAFGWVTSGGGFTLLWPYSAEIFPTKMRSTALGLCSATSRLGSTLTPLVVGGVLTATGSVSAVFAVLAFPVAVILLLWIFTAREMARRRIE